MSDATIAALVELFPAFRQGPEAESSSSLGWVYFIQSDVDGLIKIGRSVRPLERFSDLQAQYAPASLSLLATYPAPPREETRLHALFVAHRARHPAGTGRAQVQGRDEWFSAAPELLAYIAERKLEMSRRARGGKRRLPTVLNHEEIAALMKAPNIRCPTGLRNRCMLELMYRAGLRVGEVVKLKPRDLDIEAGSIRIWAGKGGDGTAYFDSDSLRTLIEMWKATRRALPRSEWLFCTLKGEKVSTRYVQQMFQRMRRRAKIDTRATPHTLRHTFATELLDEGFTIREVQNALRHADLSTTEIYTHVLDSNLRAKMQTRKR